MITVRSRLIDDLMTRRTNIGRDRSGNFQPKRRSVGSIARLFRPICIVIFAAAGCAQPPISTVLMDLSKSGAEFADLRIPTNAIDFGTPEARTHLNDGWSINERWGNKETFVWSLGRSSSLTIKRYSLASTNLRFRCRPFLPSEARESAQSVQVTINDAPLTTVPLQGDFQVYDVLVPANVFEVGINEISFQYTSTRGTSIDLPVQADNRDIAVAWDWLKIGDTGPIGAEIRDRPAGETGLGIPFNARLDFFLYLPANTFLRWDGIAVQSPNSSLDDFTVEIEVARGSTDESIRTVLHASASGKSGEIEITGQNEDVIRLSLLSYSNDTAVPVLYQGQETYTPPLTLLFPRIVELQSAGPPVPSRRPVSVRDLTEPSEKLDGTDHVADRRSQPNILIYLVDTLRADRIGAYGFPGRVSPNIDRFAARNVKFDLAFSQSSWTKTAVASIFTGLLPLSHQVLGRDDALPETLSTLPAELRSNGYETVGFSTNPNITKQFGFDRGFDSFFYLPGQPHEFSDAVTRSFSEWLRARSRSAPFFAYLHTMDPHGPYTPKPEYRKRFAPQTRTSLELPRPWLIKDALSADPLLTLEEIREDLESLYIGEIAQNDSEFGAVLDLLQGEGLLDETLVIFTSDHGEEFFDHGQWAHGKTLYREVLHVPLIVKFAGSRTGSRNVTTAVQHVDLLPSILGYIRAEVPDVHGIDVFKLTDIQLEIEERSYFSYLMLDNRNFDSLMFGGRHLIRKDPESDGLELETFDLRADFDERTSLASDDDPWTGYLRLLLLKSRRGQQGKMAQKHQAGPLNKELEEQLKALGYLD